MAEVRAAASDLGGDGVWVERVVLDTRPAHDASALADRDDALGALVRSLRGAEGEPDTRAALREALRDLAVRLPPEVREGPDGVRLDDDATLRALLAGVEPLVLAHIAPAPEDT